MLITFGELCIIIHWIYSLYENLDFADFDFSLYLFACFLFSQMRTHQAAESGLDS